MLGEFLEIVTAVLWLKDRCVALQNQSAQSSKAFDRWNESVLKSEEPASQAQNSTHFSSIDL